MTTGVEEGLSNKFSLAATNENEGYTPAHNLSAKYQINLQ